MLRIFPKNNLFPGKAGRARLYQTQAAMLEDIYNYFELSPQIGTSGQPSEAQLAEIAAAGYQAVINLALHDANYSLPDERAAVEGLGMEYVHIPVIWQQPTRQNFDDFCAALDARQGQKLFIHCAANMRVSAFMALYRILRRGKPPETAFAALHEIWMPEGVWKNFMEQVLSGG